ncbi:MAG: formyltransferase family protein, partial [Candidatus Actinomarinaceae bacterium]
MFNYFFGSDKRSIDYLKIIYKNNSKLTVVTLPHKPSGRGRKLKPNPVEEFCINNDIQYKYYQPESVYENMSAGLCVSFGLIFSNRFLKNNNPIYNLHLSLLPKFRGPSPVESLILNNSKLAGFSIFRVNSEIDKGLLYFQDSFPITSETYASDIYDKVCLIFESKYEEILNCIGKNHIQNKSTSSVTSKFIKSDYNLIDKKLDTAKKMIRAFDVIGPAFIKHNDQVFKIHKYTENVNEFPIELTDGMLY